MTLTMMSSRTERCWPREASILSIFSFFLTPPQCRSSWSLRLSFKVLQAVVFPHFLFQSCSKSLRTSFDLDATTESTLSCIASSLMETFSFLPRQSRWRRIWSPQKGRIWSPNSQTKSRWFHYLGFCDFTCKWSAIDSSLSCFV